MARIKPGEAVLIVLREPREKIFGILGEIDTAGVSVRGIDLNAFDDWTRALAAGELFFGLTDSFFPMWRVERITHDEDAPDLPSLTKQFRRRTNLEITDF